MPRTRAISRALRIAICAGLAWSLAVCAVIAELRFTDATASSGIEFKNLCGAQIADKGYVPEYMGAGAGWLDYDGDGNLDLYLVNGSTLERADGAGEPNRLFRGDGRGSFTDVTSKSGTGNRGWGYGVAIADYDNDGHPDIYVTNLKANVLYRNRGDGTFEDVTRQAGVGNESWGTSAAFFDMESDGDLDLYVANYVEFDVETVPRRGSTRAKPPFCDFRGIPVVCGPRGLPPAQDVIYRNDGDGTFTDVTRESGMWLRRARYSLGIVSFDYDDDGDQDLFVGNDSVMNSLWRNRGNGTFEDVGLATLTALNAAGSPQACMGTSAGDYDGDGWLDLVVTNFSHDLNTVYRNGAGKFFVDESTTVGMPATAMELSWGVGFRDLDQDRDLDLFIANGHVYPEVDGKGIGTSYRQKNHLFENDSSVFRLVLPAAGSALASERSYRGTAFGDYDGDGDVDILVTALDAPVQLLRNDTTDGGSYLTIRLRGSVSNRDGVGARVHVTAGGQTQLRERYGGGSYLSASEGVLHFGLGDAARVERVEVRWPGGGKQTLNDVKIDRVLEILEKGP